MIDASNPRQLGYAARCRDDLVQGHAAKVATGNRGLQAELLPYATAVSVPLGQTWLMEKRGDPLTARRLLEARLNLGLTQEALADGSGVGRSTIACIETARRPAGRGSLVNLADFFNVPLDYFTNRDDLMASAMWILGRLPTDELEAWVKLMTARATRDRLPPRD